MFLNAGFDVHCPNMIGRPPFSYEEEQKAIIKIQKILGRMSPNIFLYVLEIHWLCRWVKYPEVVEINPYLKIFF